jgi:cation diffusion facilitator family transporter
VSAPHTHAHVHDYGGAGGAAERSSWIVLWITVATMVLEIGAGWWFNSMALLADGWHMGSHALAIGLTALAYGVARRWARDPRFAFGTWKVEVLAGFASAVGLLGVALAMVVGSVERLLTPTPIGYREALVVAVLGLVVNLVCAWILGRAQQADDHHHGPDHGHGDHHAHRHHDLNLRSATVHVLTDAATSVLAILALAGGWWLGWAWLDPAMGLVGALLVALWSRGLIADTAAVLLDREMDHPVVDEIRAAVEGDDGATQVTDLHVWRVGRRVYACAVALTTRDASLTPDAVRARIAEHEEVVHSTIEIQHAQAGCGAASSVG